MTPILVPTLAELGIELSKAIGIYTSDGKAWDEAAARGETPTFGHPLDEAAEQSLDAVWGIISQIEDIPAASLADLRVKAAALNWEQRVLQTGSTLEKQLVAGLLDERFAR